MSGGSMNYICYRLEEEADKIPDMELRDLVRDIGKLLHDLEWYLSSDYCEGDWLESADAFRKKWLRTDGKERMKEYIDKATHDMHDELMEMIGFACHCQDCSKFKPKANGKYGRCEKFEHCSVHRSNRICDEFEGVE